ncbi:MAG: amino acid permease [Candidatus Eremiobacteraeota bacterium]|nr:amino acid permease [Candidatus Eremiobacteraeota bacterium]
MSKLKKEFKLIDVFAISTGAMISSGLFVLPGMAYSVAGPAMILAYLVAGLMYIPAMLSYAELSTAMPRSGGSYFFVDRSMGPIPGTIGGMSEWLSLILKSSFALIGIGAFATIFFPGMAEIHIKLIATAFCVFFVILNIHGVKEAGKLQVALVIGLIVILVLYVVEGFSKLDPMNFSPFMPQGKLSILSAAGLVYISFAGLTKVVNMGEEIKNPGRNIPLGMALAFITVIIIYVLVTIVTVGIVPGSELSGNLAPLALGGKKMMGTFGEILITVAALFAFATTANAGIMAASRTPVSMSRDGHLPTFLHKIHPKYHTPRNAILLTGTIMIAFILLLDIRTFVKTASVVMLILLTMICIAVIVMRESKLYNYKPIFRSPFYPYVQIIGILAYSYLLLTIGVKPLVMTAILLFAGFIWYWIYARIRINRESALVHVIERFMDTKYDRDLAQEKLATELKEIVKERDEVVEDLLDRLVTNATAIELEDGITRDEFFKLVSEQFADRYQIEARELFEHLQKREAESTSEILPGLAIPHIIIDGKCEFSLLMARSKEGIDFSPGMKPAHAIFVFIGTKEMRSLYLRSLVAITEIAQQKDFEEFWRNARDEEELRNIILMGERKRVHMINCLHCPEDALFEEKKYCPIYYDEEGKVNRGKGETGS